MLAAAAALWQRRVADGSGGAAGGVGGVQELGVRASVGWSVGWKKIKEEQG